MIFRFLKPISDFTLLGLFTYQYYKEFQIWKGLKVDLGQWSLKFLGPLCYKKINEDPGWELDPTRHNLRVCMLELKELTCLNDQDPECLQVKQ